jgi:hypothetical protein
MSLFARILEAETLPVNRLDFFLLWSQMKLPKEQQ